MVEEKRKQRNNALLIQNLYSIQTKLKQEILIVFDSELPK